MPTTLQLHDLKNSKEAVYSALDAWVAWEENFPIALLKRALLVLEKEQEWHRVVQVIIYLSLCSMPILVSEFSLVGH